MGSRECTGRLCAQGLLLGLLPEGVCLFGSAGGCCPSQILASAEVGRVTGFGEAPLRGCMVSFTCGRGRFIG